MSNRTAILDQLQLGGYNVTAIEDSLASNDPQKLATQHAVKTAIDAISIGAGNTLNAINILTYGAVPNNSSTPSRNANLAAWNAAKSAAADNQLIVMSDGEYYFPASQVIFTSTVKKFNILIIGDSRFLPGGGYVLEGNFHRMVVAGIIDGGNAGASDVGTYTAYTGDGLDIRNCDKCNIDFNLIINCFSGLKVGGNSTTVPKGTQYCMIRGMQIKDCYADVYMTTTGTTDGTTPGDNGNWNNANTLEIAQLGGFAASNNASHGIYALLIQKGASSNQGDPFNRNVFKTFFEGSLNGIKAEKANSNIFMCGGFEFSKVTNKISLREDNTGSLGCFNNTFVGTTLYESYFIAGGKGITTRAYGPILTDNGVPSADLLMGNGAGGYIALVGDEPSSRTSVHNMFAIDGLQGVGFGERFAAKVIRSAGAVNDYIKLHGHISKPVGATYTPGFQERTILASPGGATMTVNMPPAAQNNERLIRVKNINATKLVNVGNVAAGNTTVLPPGHTAEYECDGAAWYDTMQKVGGASMGTYQASSDADVTISEGAYSCCIANQTADRTMTLPDPALCKDRVINIHQRTGGLHTINLSRSIYNGGTSSPTSAILNDNDFTIQSDGVRWQIIGQRL